MGMWIASGPIAPVAPLAPRFPLQLVLPGPFWAL